MTHIDLDQAPVAPRGSLGGVPVVDLSAPHEAVAAAIAQACRDWGFFQVTGHGVSGGEVERVIATARAFFARPREAKRRQLRSRDNPWGFYDRELTKEQRDRKEVFDIGPDAGGFAAVPGDPFEGLTPWPEMPQSFQPAMRDWFAAMAGVAQRLVALIGEGLSDGGEMSRAFTPAHTSYLRLNFYPLGDALAEETGSEARLGIHHHTDAGALTVLLQDGVGGLQVHHLGQWHDVEPLPGAFTINIGDMVQVWSNDRYRAPPHRVLAMDRAERISIPFFYNPAYSADIRPLIGTPHYAPLNWGEFRRRRADGDFADYGTEVQISDWRVAAM
ncbi:isopenicillin N synthase family dioxygenase [Sphingomonas sp. URHD0057]|uniref:isopenicillin N synthase family dioxygenase n=1 Tax=Sphingomonas sp. URHD0057 TaxID=1380389 RepID=UPI00048D9203|nr:2OG-Fe(II) oxygenase family protein [Sphingomonas sp. URHD0057]